MEGIFCQNQSNFAKSLLVLADSILLWLKALSNEVVKIGDKKVFEDKYLYQLQEYLAACCKDLLMK